MASLVHLQDEAYKKVFFCFAAGSYTLEKEQVLTLLREEFCIPNERHRELSEEASRKRKQMAEAARPRSPPRQFQPPMQHYTAPQRHRFSTPHSYTPHEATMEPPRSPFNDAASQDTESADYAPAPAPRGLPSKKRPASAASTGRKRQKKAEDAGYAPANGTTHLPPPKKSARLQQATANGGKAGAVADIDPYVGYKVRRNWGTEGWYEGLITDYSADKEEHCICYDMGLPNETYEWYDVRNAPRSECQLTGELFVPLPGAPAAGTNHTSTRLHGASGSQSYAKLNAVPGVVPC